MLFRSDRDCDVTDLTHNWVVSGGVFANGMTTTTTNSTDADPSVTVTWDNTPGGSLKLTSEASTLDDCEAYVLIEISKERPTFAGQVKYWNDVETYMPTPFPTSINGTYPADYFYIELWHNTFSPEGVYYTGNDGEVLVQPHIEVGNELMSYWEFDLPFDEVMYGCETDFFVKIWDGGYIYDPNYPSGNGFNEYLGASYTYNNWGGVNATDAAALLKMAGGEDINSTISYTWVGPQTGISPNWDYGFYSNGIADVNKHNGITALDPLTANYRSVGLIQNFPYVNNANLFSKNFEVAGRLVDELPKITWTNTEPWFVGTHDDDLAFTHSDADYQYYDQATDHKYSSEAIPWDGTNMYMNIYYEAIGDINASYVPTSAGFKSYEGMELVYDGKIMAGEGDELIVPVRADVTAEVSAISLFMTYQNDLVEVIDVNYEEDYFMIDHEKGVVNIGWFTSEAKEIKAGDVIAKIKVRVIGDIDSDTELFNLEAGTELADAEASPIPGVTFKSMSLTSDPVGFTATELDATNYPNPFKENTTIEFVLPEAGKVQLKVFNEMGQLVGTFVDATLEAGIQTYELNNNDLEAGVYFYQITLKGISDYAVTKSMVVFE